MKALEKAGFLAVAQSRVFVRHVSEAQELIAKALALGGKWCVAFSGGKDSTVMLDLVRQQKPDIAVVWLDDGWDYPETLAFVAETEKRIGHILRIALPVSNPFWRETPYPGDDPAFSHPTDMGIEDYKRAYQGNFVGVRAEESGARRMALRRFGSIHRSEFGTLTCWPLGKWRTADVWAYIMSHDLPYNPAYDKLAELGVPLEKRRVGPVTAFMVWQYGVVSTLRQGWPELFYRFAQKCPEIVRYT